MNLTLSSTLNNEHFSGHCVLNYHRKFCFAFTFSERILFLWIKMEKLLCTWWYFSGRKDDNKSSFRWKSLLCAFRPLRTAHSAVDSNTFWTIITIFMKHHMKFQQYGWRTFQPQTFQPQASTPDLSTMDFSTPDFSTTDFSTMNFSTPDFSTPDIPTPSMGLKNLGLESPGLESSWLKGLGLKLGVEMSFNRSNLIQITRGAI